jgi:hypothetical protein
MESSLLKGTRYSNYRIYIQIDIYGPLSIRHPVLKCHSQLLEISVLYVDVTKSASGRGHHILNLCPRPKNSHLKQIIQRFIPTRGESLGVIAPLMAFCRLVGS